MTIDLSGIVGEVLALLIVAGITGNVATMFVIAKNLAALRVIVRALTVRLEVLEDRFPVYRPPVRHERTGNAHPG